jgi:hypothetical protein
MRRYFTTIYAETNDLSRGLVNNPPEREFSNSPRRGVSAPLGAPILDPFKDESFKHEPFKDDSFKTQNQNSGEPVRPVKPPPLKRPTGSTRPLGLPKSKAQRKSRAKAILEPGRRYSVKSPSRIHGLNSDPDIICKREMTQRRRREETKSRQDHEFYSQKLGIVSTGGIWSQPTEYYPRGRRYSGETVEKLKCAGRRLGAASVAMSAAKSVPATTGLHGLGTKDAFRSQAEELAFAFDLRHLKLFNDSAPTLEELSYPELDFPESSNEISATFFGHLTYFTRDLDHTLCATKYQTQVKGTDFLFKTLEQALKPVTVDSPTEFQYRFRKFELLHKTLTDFVIRDLTNFLSSCLCEPDSVRRLLYRSFRSASYWDKIDLFALTEEALLRLYKRESKRMFRHWKQILRTIFPASNAVIDHAESLFMRLYNSGTGKQLTWTPETIASQVLAYLEQAKIDLAYDDSSKALFRNWLKWRKSVKYRFSGKYDGQLIPESITGLPKRFKPTKTHSLHRASELYLSNEKTR